MKFLSKHKNSIILTAGLTYKKNASSNNAELLNHLKEEQKNFCAYTETYFKHLDTVHVEHFDSSKKYNDNYFNYYAVLGSANQYKKDGKYISASFFSSLFFQDINEFNKRIAYNNGIYYEVNETDTEAKDFIDFIGLNHPKLEKDRANHIARLKDVFNQGNYDSKAIINYFTKHKTELSFITAIENHFKINLSTLYS